MLDQDCPDLSGHYRYFNTTISSRARSIRTFPSARWTRAMRPLPEHHPVWSIEAIDGEGMHLRTAAGAADMVEAFRLLHQTRRHTYDIWRAQVRLPFDIAREQAGLDQYLPRSSKRLLPATEYECGGGWLAIRDHTGSKNASPWAARIARANDGGLLARTYATAGGPIMLWWGRRCEFKLPLPRFQREVWWYAAPVPPADDLPVDWPALLAKAPRPPPVVHSPEAAAPRPADTGQPILLEAGQAVDTSGHEHIPTPADSDHQRYWNKRLVEWLPAGVQLDPVICGGPRCRARGSAPAMPEVAQLLRSISGEGRASPELEIIEQRADGRYSFSITLNAAAR